MEESGERREWRQEVRERVRFVLGHSRLTCQGKGRELIKGLEKRKGTNMPFTKETETQVKVGQWSGR